MEKILKMNIYNRVGPFIEDVNILSTRQEQDSIIHCSKPCWAGEEAHPAICVFSLGEH